MNRKVRNLAVAERIPTAGVSRCKWLLVSLTIAACSPSSLPHTNSRVIPYLAKEAVFNGVLIDARGRTLTFGTAVSQTNPEGLDAFVARYRGAEADSNFGEGGFLTIKREGWDVLRSFNGIVDSAGRIVGCGIQYNWEPLPTGERRLDGRAILFRLAEHGVLDSSFGSQGFFELPSSAGSATSCRGVAETPSGYLMLAANSPIPGSDADQVADPHQTFVSRITGEGILDESYASDGMMEIPGGDYTSARMIGDKERGHYVSYHVESETYRSTVDVHVRRLLPTGELDTAFRNSGDALISASSDAGFNYVVYGIALNQDGRLFLAGERVVGDQLSPVLLCMTPQGVPVSSVEQASASSFAAYKGQRFLSLSWAEGAMAALLGQGNPGEPDFFVSLSESGQFFRLNKLTIRPRDVYARGVAVGGLYSEKINASLEIVD